MNLLKRRYLQVVALIAAIRPALALTRGSLPQAMRRAVGVLRREGLRGLIRRANILTGRPVVALDAASVVLYGDIPPLAPDFRPLVSVIVPNFNHAPYLAQRLESIFCQTYVNFEVILLDDCSTDDSLAVLRDYAARYPEKTVCHFNETNSGGVFHQWKKGLKLAKGELVWIAESDDYCAETFLEELVRCFQNDGVKLAFGHTDFVRGTPPETVWSLPLYLSELGLPFWDRPFIRSAHALVNAGWVAKNFVANVSGAVFRHPRDLALFQDPEWLAMRLCGDWVFYLTLIRGGLVAYNPAAVNYYRQHVSNTSLSVQKQNIYYREHEIVARRAVSLYEVAPAGLAKQAQLLHNHWCLNKGDHQTAAFQELYDLDRCLAVPPARHPNIMMAVYALSAGGGETFPILLANELAEKGYAVTLLNCARQATEDGVRTMLSPKIAIVQPTDLDLIGAIYDDLGIALVHSHHAWVDMTLAQLLIANKSATQVVSTHGMYEMMSAEQIQSLMPLLRGRIDAFVYTAEKNLTTIPAELRAEKIFRRIDNALPEKPIDPIARGDLGIDAKDFVLCLVARAIPEKGWAEAVAAVELANQTSARRIQLLLIGEGPEYDRLAASVGSETVHFLGFRKNIRDYFAASDMGFLPSRFEGESAPLVLIDCLLSGKPMLASDIGEIRNMLSSEEGLAGTVFGLDNWKIDGLALARLIVELANDARLLAKLSARVPAAAMKFEMGTMVERYEAVYAAALSRSLEL